MSADRAHSVWRDLPLSLAFCSCLLVVGAWYGAVATGRAEAHPARGRDDDFRELMARERRGFEPLSASSFAVRAFQDGLDGAAADNFPHRASLVPAYASAERLLGRLALAPLPRRWAPVWPVGGGDVVTDGERLYDRPRLAGRIDLEPLRRQARFYAELADRHAGLSLAAFAVLPTGDVLATVPEHQAGARSPLMGEGELIAFRELAGPGLCFSWDGAGRPARERLERHYRTDHHFTMRGAYEAYGEILALLAKGGPSERVAVRRWFVVPGVEFRGSIARRALAYAAIWDPLDDADFDLPRLVPMQPGLAEALTRRREYDAGKPPEGLFANHYGYYYGTDTALVGYRCPSADGGRLLVISDSYDNGMHRLLASHFGESYFVDPRHWSERGQGALDIDAFIRRHRITHVLFFGAYRQVLGIIPWELA